MVWRFPHHDDFVEFPGPGGVVGTEDFDIKCAIRNLVKYILCIEWPVEIANARMVTARGVWVCPILVNEPTARMGARLADTLVPFPLGYSACWTCHVHGVSCKT